MEKRNYKVYIHICPNGKMYIGITSQKPEYRWNDGNGYKKQLFYRAIKKYGWNNIKHIIIYDNLTKEEAEKIEVKLIKMYKTNEISYGYNILDDINTNKTERNKSKKRISREIKDSTKEKLRKSNLGKKLSLQTKIKLSKLRKNKPNFKNRKKVICIETGIIYDGLISASKNTNIKIGNIQSVCSGRTKTAGGLHWKYYI